MRNIISTTLILTLFGTLAYGQVTRVLFIGNSYTGVNNLPQMTYDAAISTSDTLIIDSHTPGGTRLLNHATDPQALAKINSQSWNYVVLQAQSQEPSWPISQVQTDVFPYATQLCNAIRANNKCSMPVFYMTWGRKTGDASNCASWPPVCTYIGMDSLLHKRYQTMGNDNNALVSPVGAVWHYVRDTYPSIDLYASDNSHPSMAGSYAAACTFYTVFLRKDPTLITYTAGLPAATAEKIRLAAKTIVFDDLLEWNIGKYDPVSKFSWTKSQQTAFFLNQSKNADSYLWNFGDGDTSSLESPQHTYNLLGQYEVELKVQLCNRESVKLDTVAFYMGVNDQDNANKISLYPNPSCSAIVVTIDSPNSIKPSYIEIYDIMGKMVFGKTIQDNEIVISVANFTTGMYSYKVGEQTGTFLVE
tara:strand:+ start:10914 stop:12164 length:1251 start_codon:yes stop_codon:yes gene_type:complete